MSDPWNPDVLRSLSRALPSPRRSAHVSETTGGEAFVIEVPVPGLGPEEIRVEADPDSVTVFTCPRDAGDESDRVYLVREQSSQPASHVVEFPGEIDTDGVTATLEHGMLRIRAPKAAAGRRRAVRIG
jgi:HSP20 family protein